MKQRLFLSLTCLLLLLFLCACGQTETVETTETIETTVETAAASEEVPEAAAEEETPAESEAETEPEEEADPLDALPETGYGVLDGVLYWNREPVAADHMTALRLYDLETEDYSFLAQYTELTYLELVGCSFTDLSCLVGLDQLEILNLYDCADLSDLSALAELPALDSLGIDGCGAITDLSTLSGCCQLTGLGLGDCPALTALTGLSAMTGLQSLGLRDLDGLTDLSDLVGAESLTYIRIRYCDGISDLSPLAEVTGLETIVIVDCPDVSDLSPLASLPALASLTLEQVAVTDLSPLAEMGSLRELDLCNVPVSDISALAGLTQLEYLRLEETGVTDFSLLLSGTFSCLESLTCAADEETAAALREVYPYCSVNGEQLREPYYEIVDGALYYAERPVDTTSTELVLNMDGGLDTLSFLPQFTALEDLTIFHCASLDLSPISQCTSLLRLRLGGLDGAALPDLSGLDQLIELELNAVSQNVVDLSALTGAPSLQYLILNGVPDTDLSLLADMPVLAYLTIKDHVDMMDFSILAELTGLKGVYITSETFDDLSVLSGLSGLEELYLYNTAVTDYSVLLEGDFPDLTYIYCGADEETVEALREVYPDAIIRTPG